METPGLSSLRSFWACFEQALAQCKCPTNDLCDLSASCVQSCDVRSSLGHLRRVTYPCLASRLGLMSHGRVCVACFGRVPLPSYGLRSAPPTGCCCFSIRTRAANQRAASVGPQVASTTWKGSFLLPVESCSAPRAFMFLVALVSASVWLDCRPAIR